MSLQFESWVGLNIARCRICMF